MNSPRGCPAPFSERPNLTLHYRDESLISNAVKKALEESRKEQEEKELRKIHESILSVLEHSGEEAYENAFTRETGLKKYLDSVEVTLKAKDRGSDSPVSDPYVYSADVSPYRGFRNERVLVPAYNAFNSLSGETFSELDSVNEKVTLLTDTLARLALNLRNFQTLKGERYLSDSFRHFTDEILDSKELKLILEAMLVFKTASERKSAVDKLSRENNKDLLNISLTRFNLEVKSANPRRVISAGAFINERVNGYNCSALCLALPGGRVDIVKVGEGSYSGRFKLLREEAETGKPLPYERRFFSTGRPIYAGVLNWLIDRHKEEEDLKEFQSHSEYSKSMENLLYISEKFLNEKELLKSRNSVTETTPEEESETPKESTEETSQVKEFFTKQ